MISSEVGMSAVPQVTQALDQIRAPHENACKKCEPLMVANNLYKTTFDKKNDVPIFYFYNLMLQKLYAKKEMSLTSYVVFLTAE